MVNEYSKDVYNEIHKMYNLVESVKGCRSAIVHRVIDKYGLTDAQQEEFVNNICGGSGRIGGMDRKLNELYLLMGTFATTQFLGDVGFEEPSESWYQDVYNEFICFPDEKIDKKLSTFISKIQEMASTTVGNIEIALNDVISMGYIDLEAHPAANEYAEDIVCLSEQLKDIIDNRLKTIQKALNAQKEKGSEVVRG